MDLLFFPSKRKVISRLSEIQGLILDFDGTLVDYYLNEEKALIHVFQSYKLNKSDYSKATKFYQKINGYLWKEFEKGNITMQEIRKTRFEKLLAKFRLKGDPLKVNRLYLQKFVEEVPPDNQALDSLKKLRNYRPDIKVVILTNGAHEIQKKRLSKLGYNKIVDEIYTSGSLGYSKPDLRAFEPVVKDLEVEKEKIWMVGDSISSDILGAKRVGISSVFIDPKMNIDLENGIRPDIVCGHFSNFTNFLTSITE